MDTLVAPHLCLAAATAVLLLLSATADAAVATPPDFIIVGGGTAGCTLASRLCTGLMHSNILILERGAFRNATDEFLVRSPRQTPVAWSTLSLTTVWASAPAPGLGGRPVTLRTGATLGGSSSINAAQWAEPVGDEAADWGVAGLDAPAARRAYARASQTVGAAVPPPDLRYSYGDEWLAAARRAGLPTVDDVTGAPPQRGAWLNRLAVSPSGRRVDACAAYVAPVLWAGCAGRLRVRTGVTVSAVRLERGAAGADGRRPLRATGVDVISSAEGPAGRPHTLRARRAVLLAAGPFGTPQLLLLSGIGRPAALRSAGVVPRVDLPVGEGATTRSFTGVGGEYSGVPLARVNNETLLTSAVSRRDWEYRRGGVLAQAAFMGLGRLTTGVGAYISTTFSSIGGPPGTPVFSSSCHVNPESRGRLVLADRSVFTPPTVHTGLFEAAADMVTAVACVRHLRRVVRAFAPSFGMAETAPGADAALGVDWVRATSDFAGHYVGGAAVGRVLDATLRVKGVAGLYVIDASAIPTMPRSAGPMSSVYMLAEHAATEMIRRYSDGEGGWK